MSGREVVGYVVREGKVRGEGRYMGPKSGKSDWRNNKRVALLSTSRDYAMMWVTAYGGRVVRLVKRAPAVQPAAPDPERAARAAYDTAREAYGWTRPWERLEGPERTRWVPIAQAVLDAVGPVDVEAARALHAAIKDRDAARADLATVTAERDTLRKLIADAAKALGRA